LQLLPLDVAIVAPGHCKEVIASTMDSDEEDGVAAAANANANATAAAGVEQHHDSCDDGSSRCQRVTLTLLSSRHGPEDIAAAARQLATATSPKVDASLGTALSGNLHTSTHVHIHVWCLCLDIASPTLRCVSRVRLSRQLSHTSTQKVVVARRAERAKCQMAGQRRR
jgi:hypothetical protein